MLQSYGLLIIAVGALLITSPVKVVGSTTLTLLGDSMHIHPASYVPLPFLPGRIQQTTSNPAAKLVRSGKVALTSSEQEIFSLLGGVLIICSITMMVFATSLSYSKSNILSLTTDDGRTARKSSAEVGVSIAKLVTAQDLFLIVGAIHVFVMGNLVVWTYLTKESVAVDARGPHLSWWTLMANQTNFVLALTDMLFWGYLYTVLKEERREILVMAQARREVDDEERINARE